MIIWIHRWLKGFWKSLELETSLIAPFRDGDRIMILLITFLLSEHVDPLMVPANAMFLGSTGNKKPGTEKNRLPRTIRMHAFFLAMEQWSSLFGQPNSHLLEKVC